ncbi:hypothetical protein NAEGRDRAFT_80168 [Naegleria gruberi]|uniref:Uncharacterized protein n=1 Tax=Naegleria gruberi TaxID=5762 RepID=D2VJ90_NAEGR|nr:uncharacterized protein NAEGRDRAFT_80168 [Naegleria gruberi]EFC43241.1 hypothetical protein NAEGRDRAFT_80168 [Naegleria gruberi]|eukprot:XP_002675985.1 hypothetical protein NAEGRDRAFT_80168 [Naegleria gruberi strain NEG-M]
MIKLVTFLLFSLTFVLFISSSFQTGPIWPYEWSTLAYQNSGGFVDTNPSKLATYRIFNSYQLKAERIEIQFFNEPLLIQIHAGFTQYSFYPHNNTCNVVELGFNPLPYNWLQNATFAGNQVVNGVNCRVWKRLTSTYWEDETDGTPVKVNESDFFVWNFISGTFKAGNQNKNLFDIPVYCKKNRK